MLSRQEDPVWSLIKELRPHTLHAKKIFFNFFFHFYSNQLSCVIAVIYLTSAAFNFFIYEMGLIIPTLSGKLWEKIRWDGAKMPAVH